VNQRFVQENLVVSQKGKKGLLLVVGRRESCALLQSLMIDCVAPVQVLPAGEGPKHQAVLAIDIEVSS